MKITKLGHCALVIDESGKKLLTDPGNFTSEAQEAERDLAVILITHEHADHLHIDSVKALAQTNPQAKIVSNASVGKLLNEAGLECMIVGDGQSAEVHGFSIEGFGKEHAEIYGQMGLVENTGYLVDGRFYFPGDNFHEPGKPIDILALPVAGPWMKMSMAIDFAKKVKAKKAFGVHDGMIVPSFRGFVAMALKMFVPETEYTAIADGETKEF